MAAGRGVDVAARGQLGFETFGAETEGVPEGVALAARLALDTHLVDLVDRSVDGEVEPRTEQVLVEGGREAGRDHRAVGRLLRRAGSPGWT